MDFFGRVTVALANIDSDGELLQYARMLSELSEERSEFCFVHVLRTESNRNNKTSHDQARAQLRNRVGEHFGGGICCHVLNGSRVDRLLEFAAESGSDIILVGQRSTSSGRRSLGRRLAMQAPCSVWMVPQGSPARISRVLAAVDFSDHSAHALSLATLLARRRGLERCIALHVYFEEALVTTHEFDQQMRESGERKFERFVAPLDLHEVEVQPRLEESPNVSDTIERVAQEEGVDLVVIGTRGQSRSAAVLLGSESEQTLRQTRRPLLVTKHPGERIGLLEVLLDRKLQPRHAPRFG